MLCDHGKIISTSRSDSQLGKEDSKMERNRALIEYWASDFSITIILMEVQPKTRLVHSS
jgi:hypothetical protein